MKIYSIPVFYTYIVGGDYNQRRETSIVHFYFKDPESIKYFIPPVQYGVEGVIYSRAGLEIKIEDE